MKKTSTKKLVLAAIFTALAVMGSLFSVPVLGAKCAPVQHLVNIVSAVLLGPWWAVGIAFCSSCLRLSLGLGTLLAFPGSMCGALLSGILYKSTKMLPGAYVGEVFGTAVLGGMLAYPIAAFVMGNKTAAVFAFVIPFFISTAGGAALAIVILTALKKTGMLEKMKMQLED